MTRLSYTEIVGRHLHLCFENFDDIVLPLPDRTFPVIVTSTRTHVIWVQAQDQDTAVNRAHSWDIDAELECEDTRVAEDLQIEAPARHQSDWLTITRASSHGYEGTPYDGHVVAHQALLHHQERAAKVAACAANGHPDRRRWVGMTTCELCNTVVERDNDRPQSTIVQPEAAAGVNDRA